MSLIADALKQAQDQRRPDAANPEKARRMLGGAGPLRVESSGRPEVTGPLAIAGTALAAAIAIFGAVVILSPDTRLVPTTAYADPAPRGSGDQAGATPLDPTELPPPELSAIRSGDGSTSYDADADGPYRTGATRGAGDTGRAGAAGSGGAAWSAEYAGDVAGSGADAAAAPMSGYVPDETAPALGSFRLEMSGGGSQQSRAGDGFALGVAAQRRGEHDVAVHYYRQALAAAPDDPQIHNNLGTAYRELGFMDEALTAFEAAVAVDPTYAPAWSNLGVMLDRTGQGQEAARAYREALRLDPSNPAARVNLAIRYHATGLLADALDLLTGVLRDQPALPEAHYAMARLLDDQGDVVGAVRHYRLFLNTGRGQFTAGVEEQVARRVALLEDGGNG